MKTLRITLIFFFFFGLIITLYSFGQEVKEERKAKNTPTITNKDHNKKEVVAFVYHRFGDDKYPSTNISLALFEKHLSYLKSNEFKVLTFGDAVDYLNDPEIPYFEKVACITIDDGYKTFQSNAVPLLQKYGFKATVFINSGSVGGGSYMDWNDLKAIHDQGIEIGNHSHSHAYFLNTPQDTRKAFFEEDVQLCQKAIHDHLGFSSDIFSYPYGEFDLEMKEVLKKLGFKGAVAQNSGVLYAGDNYAFARFPMAGSYAKMEGFIEKANMKALRIPFGKALSYVLEGANPPTLEVEFNSTGADLNRLNCFTSGECELSVTGNTVTMKTKNKLNARRTLYTITAPAKKGNAWYWYSHLWIRSEVKE